VVDDIEEPQEDIDLTFKGTVTRAVSKIDAKEVIEKPSLDVLQPTLPFPQNQMTDKRTIGSKQDLPNAIGPLLDVDEWTARGCR
jgi:hypothetical protein